MADIVSRRSFISAASVLSLAACAGGGNSLSMLTPSDPNADLYSMMRRLGIAAFQEKGRSLVLPEYSHHDFFAGTKAPECGMPLARRSAMACTTTGGALQQIANIVIQDTGGSGSLTIDAAPFDFSDIQGTDLQANLNYNGVNSIGPIYSCTPPLPKNCVGETIGAIGSAITAIGSYMMVNISKYGSLGFWIQQFAAAEITAAEFIGVVLATLSLSDLAIIIAAIGATALTVSSLYLYAKCMSGG